MNQEEPKTTTSSMDSALRLSPDVDAEGGLKSTPTFKIESPTGGFEKEEGFKKVYARHGRVDLVPMPSDDPADPYNWSPWRKHALLLQAAFHAMMGPFSAAAVIPAFGNFVEDFGVSITQASYFVSVPIIFMGFFPLLWAPISSRIGRRPVYLASALISAACHLGGAYCTSYGTLMVTRVFQGIFLCPPQSIGAQTVNELFFQHEKGQKLGVWTLLTSLGPPLSPLIFGFVVYNKSWQWIFYILAIVNLAQFFLYIVLGPETLFDRRSLFEPEKPLRAVEEPSKTPWHSPYVVFKRRSTVSWARLPLEVVQPFTMALQLPVLLPTIAYAVSFTYTNVLLTVEVPSLLGRKYGLNSQQVGLQFIAPLIGGLLGEPIAGWGSDKFMAWRTRRASGQREPEMRLPIAFPGFILAAVGIIIFGVQLQNTPAGVWSVTPLVGSGISFFGLQLVTTVVYTYVVESQPVALAPRVPLFVALFRQVFAFTGPFYFNILFEEIGAAKAAGLLAALSGGVGFVFTALCLVCGKQWRAKQE